jgi:serine/threonine protein kinase
MNTGESVAVKLEPLTAKYPQLAYEAFVYTTMRGVAGIPRMLLSGTQAGYSVLVVEMLGTDMEDLRAASPGGHLSLQAVLQVGICMLRVLAQFHTRGFVHRDIKPENIMSKQKGSIKGDLFLIDFGLSKYVRKRDGTHISENNKKRLTGTPRYASISNHMGREQGRCDDLQALGFVMLYLLRGSLPWQNLRDFKEILQVKRDALYSESLYIHAPPCFRRYFRYVSTLRFADRPDYARARQILQEGNE